MAQCNHIGAWRLKLGKDYIFLTQLEQPACHLESSVLEDDDVTGEKLDTGDCNNCGCIIVLVSLQYNTVFPAAPLPPAPESATPPLQMFRTCLFSSLFVSLVSRSLKSQMTGVEYSATPVGGGVCPFLLPLKKPLPTTSFRSCTSNFPLLQFCRQE